MWLVSWDSGSPKARRNLDEVSDSLARAVAHCVGVLLLCVSVHVFVSTQTKQKQRKKEGKCPADHLRETDRVRKTSDLDGLLYFGRRPIRQSQEQAYTQT